MNTLPTWGVKIECPDGGCNGLPCSISPNSSGNVDSKESAVGAGGASFCVVTVPKGGTANIVTFNTDGSSGSSSGSDSGSSSSAEPSSTHAELKAGGFAAQAEKATSTTAAASSTEASSTVPASTEASTTAPASTTAAESTTAQSSEATTAAASSGTDVSSTTAKASKTASYAHARPSINPGMFHENGTSSQTTSAPSEPSQTQADAPVTTTTKKGEAGRQQGSPAFAGLIVAFVAAACFF